MDICHVYFIVEFWKWLTKSSPKMNNNIQILYRTGVWLSLKEFILKYLIVIILDMHASISD